LKKGEPGGFMDMLPNEKRLTDKSPLTPLFQRGGSMEKLEEPVEERLARA
jgi:hypothetical protein